MHDVMCSVVVRIATTRRAIYQILQNINIVGNVLRIAIRKNLHVTSKNKRPKVLSAKTNTKIS